jgi:ribonuclease HI
MQNLEKNVSGLVHVYPGSACEKQPGRGAWATLLEFNGHQKEFSGKADVTTNNRMALIAVISGLRSLLRPSAVQVITNSQYLQKGATEWIKSWRQDGRLSNGGIENAELWQEIDRLSGVHFVDWVWEKSEADPVVGRVARMAKDKMYQ